MRLTLALLVVSTACLGPPAPDADLCRDLLTRLCLNPTCESVSTTLNVTQATCLETLTARTHCGDDAFAFSAPSRNRVLACRAPLVESNASRSAAPDCADVSAMFTHCPDLLPFLNGL